MRQLSKRPRLERETRSWLALETKAIRQAADPKAEAKKRYNAARARTEEIANRKAKAKKKAVRKEADSWFEPVIQALKELAAPGQRCMYCGGSEASQVEHYRPITIFPHWAMSFRNFLFICSECNRRKLNHFPPVTEPGGRLINPLEENVWNFFFLDDLGFLTPRWRVEEDALDARAVTTRDVIALNREAVQEVRHARIKDLRGQVAKELDLYSKGESTLAEVEAKIRDWRGQPFQPEVADFFLNGPGRSQEPFASLMAAMV